MKRSYERGLSRAGKEKLERVTFKMIHQSVTRSNYMDPREHLPHHLFSLPDLSPQHARRILKHIVDHGSVDPSEWRGTVPKRIIERFSPLPRLKLDRIIKSKVDGFQKLRFITDDNLALETVIIPLHKPGCVSLCLSSQIGCVMGCSFCATARMRDRRNLKAWEILDQFVQARMISRTQGLNVTGAVFMGMGEPFLNYDNVLNTAEHIRFPGSGSVSGKAITISTVGLVKEIHRYIDEGHPYRLSISLGAATDEKRRELVPIASKTPVRIVMEAARRYAHVRNTRVNIAYVCISGKNVFVDDAIALADLIKDTPVRLDLIDVTDTSGKFQPPTDDELRVFRDALSSHLRQPVVRRYSGGKDIAAACGTLAANTLDSSSTSAI